MDGPDWEAIRKRVVSRHSKALEYLHKAEKKELLDEPKNCTPPEELQRQIMSHNEPKNEREWWACHRIEQLEAALRKIADEAFSPQDDDVIWMDDETPLGQFIDKELARAAIEGEKKND